MVRLSPPAPASRQQSPAELGRRVARVLTGIWRTPAERAPADLSRELLTVLQDDGLSGLAWRALTAPQRATPTGRALRRGALADAASAVRLDGTLADTVRALTAASVEPVVTKGWAVARYYPAPADRPYADVDLAVRPDQADVAKGVLDRLGPPARLVDLHVGLPDLPDRSWAEVFASTRVVPFGDTEVRVLAPEDQFRLLAVHFVRHVCFRPLWLVDLAVLMESAGPDVDWERALRGSHAWRRWLRAVAGLAGRLLGARVPDALRGGVPVWLEGQTLWRWGGGHRLELSDVYRRPREWGPFVGYRLLSPVRWCTRLGLPPVRFLPPVWAAALFGRAVQFPRKIWRHVARRWVPPQDFPVHQRRVL